MDTNKKLCKIDDGKVFSGVCNGLAEHLNMKVDTVRILYVVVSIFWVLPIIIYVILSFTLPFKELEMKKAEKLNDEYAYNEEDYKL